MFFIILGIVVFVVCDVCGSDVLCDVLGIFFYFILIKIIIVLVCYFLLRVWYGVM